ncbi:MAG: CRISPR-associated endonuclease/helicase Cas3 [Clostridiales bacterium]|nr:CRISPR-associated endonuclease/helicase Cas3 [Clostridiales bacterium]
MLYAKSDNKETLHEHTSRLLENMNVLRATYGRRIESILPPNIDASLFWRLVYWAVFYHDFGKAFTPFQNVIRQKIGESELDTSFYNDIPHGYLSPAFLPFDEMLNAIDANDEMIRVIVQAVAFHHERDVIPDREHILDVISKDLMPKLPEINEHMGTDIKELDVYYINDMINRITPSHKYYKIYVLLKGILHRLDHASSAHVCVEEGSQQSLAQAAEVYIKDGLHAKLRDVQVYAGQNRDKNLLIVASTGIGKTEAALMWAGEDKTFFTLPLRVTLNSLYSRIKDGIGFNKAGLLHSTAIDYLADKGYEDAVEIYEQSRQLANKLSFTTVDQIFPFAFRYKGYEKIYATLSYSKTVVDEIQAYSPRMAASILKGLEMVHDMNGSFMVMTATLPRIYKEYLRQHNVPFEERRFLSPIDRHMIEIKEMPILNDTDEIIKKGRNKKVLVLANTVARASELYARLKGCMKENEQKHVNLLHSLFIQKDRAKKEAEVQDFTLHSGYGIWVSTQIVEASLDVDFDYLFTEMSTLDSLFQRFGRCYRKRSFDLGHPNIYIYTDNVSGIGPIYDRDIWHFSIDYLNNYNCRIVSEQAKADMVDQLYSDNQLRGTEFIDEFKKSLSVLDTIQPYNFGKGEVQRIFREMNNVTGVPESVYNENKSLFDSCEAEKDKAKRADLYREIRKLTLDVPIYRAKGHIIGRLGGRLNDICLLDCEYNDEEGAVFNKNGGDIYDIVG